jgi:hypothetical protein
MNSCVADRRGSSQIVLVRRSSFWFGFVCGHNSVIDRCRARYRRTVGFFVDNLGAQALLIRCLIAARRQAAGAFSVEIGGALARRQAAAL